MNQLGITTTDPASGSRLARRVDPSTSHESAADLVGSGQLHGELERIAAGLERRPGLTSRELASAINEDRYMVAKRMTVLEARGLARRGEVRKCSESGKRAITWWPVAGGVR
jgi:DNA-binding MarR family transcriptional regulator